MPFKEISAGIAICASLFGSSSYLVGFFRGRSKPHTISWFIWAVIMFVACLGQFRKGAGPGSWPTGVGAFQTAGIFCLALRRGDTTITRFDWICLILATVTFATYCFSEEVFYSMALATSVDFLGYFPTYRKSLKDPLAEEVRPWICFATASVFTLLAIRDYNRVTVMYPCMLVLMNWTLVVILVRGRLATSRSKDPNNPS